MRRLFLVLYGLCAVTTGAMAAEYRITPSAWDALPGSTVFLGMEAETQTGDNLIGVGHFSFAIDLAVSGTAGAAGSDIGNVVINTSFFDDTFSNSLGAPDGSSYTNIGGVTTDVFAPHYGSALGDVLALFTFDLTVPTTAQMGDTIVLTPSEGFLQSLTVSEFFDPVSPQTFAGTTITVVPEPTSLVAVLASCVLVLRRRTG